MPTPPPAIHQLARQLVAREPAGVRSSGGDAGQGTRACERLRVPLAKLVGTAGVASLTSRALALAKRGSPQLGSLSVGPDGCLMGIDSLPDSGAADDANHHAGVVLVAELLGLLVTFIGYPLTLTLVRESWP